MSFLHSACKGMGTHSGRQTDSGRVCNHPKPRERSQTDSKPSYLSEMGAILPSYNKHPSASLCRSLRHSNSR